MFNTPEFWMYILPISMVMITLAIGICVTIVAEVYKEVRHVFD